MTPPLTLTAEHKVSEQELLARAKRGERLDRPDCHFVLFKAESPDPNCRHYWRTIVCSGDEDVVECNLCGKQRVTGCNFDEEYS